MFLDDRNNYCKQAKYILSRIIPPQLKFSKRQKSLLYTCLQMQTYKTNHKSYKNNNNLDHK